jgi:hypothetical protein
MMRKVLLTPEKEVESLVQRTRLFRTRMLHPIKDKEVKSEVSNTVLLMSGKELLTNVNKKEDPQFFVVRKPRIVLTSTRVDDLLEEI